MAPSDLLIDERASQNVYTNTMSQRFGGGTPAGVCLRLLYEFGRRHRLRMIGSVLMGIRPTCVAPNKDAAAPADLGSNGRRDVGPSSPGSL